MKGVQRQYVVQYRPRQSSLDLDSLNNSVQSAVWLGLKYAQCSANTCKCVLQNTCMYMYIYNHNFINMCVTGFFFIIYTLKPHKKYTISQTGRRF